MADPEYDPISYTARKILEVRARCTQIPLAREMADALQVPWKPAPLRDGLRNLVWGRVRSGRYLQLRYDAISGALRAYPGAAVLEIAAGYSTRGLVEAEQREAYVESDLAELIGRKRQLLGMLRQETAPNHHTLPFNVCSEESTEQALEFLRGLKLTRPLVVIHEGLLMYLDRAERSAARDHIRTLLQQASPAGGAWITTDFSERELDETFAQRLMSRRLKHRVERRLHYFTDEDAVGRFLSEGGLSFERHANPAAGSTDRELLESGENFRAWTITAGTSASLSLPREAASTARTAPARE